MYVLLRKLHLYLGLLLSPTILLFAVSACALTIQGLTAESRPVRSSRGFVPLPSSGDSVVLARFVRHQLSLPGEIGFVQHKMGSQQLRFPLDRPGERTEVSVNLRSGAYEWVRSDTGLIDALIYLHKKPGPHNVALRGNWWPMRWWGWLADATVYLVLFVSASGVYLWTLIRRERRLGLILLGAGALTLAASIVAVVA